MTKGALRREPVRDFQLILKEIFNDIYSHLEAKKEGRQSF